MSDTNDDFGAKLAALAAQVAELAKLVEAAKPPAPFKSEWTRPANPIDRASMPKVVVQEMANSRLNAAIDDKLMADLRNDAYPHLRDNAAPPERKEQREEVVRGSGWVEPRKLEPVPGLSIMDQMMDRQDELDRADLARRLSRSGTSKDQPK